MVEGLILAAAVAHAAPVDPVAERERPAIQSVLERALQAQKAKDWDALRARLTPEYIELRRREGSDRELEVFNPKSEMIRIKTLEVEPGARWARATLEEDDRSPYGKYDLFRFDGAWKLEDDYIWGPIDYFRLFQAMAKSAGGPLKPPESRPAPTPRLDGRIIDRSALPTGWQLSRSKDVGGIERWPPVAEAAHFDLIPGDGKPTGVFRILLFHDSRRAEWYFWREARALKRRERKVARPFGDEVIMSPDVLLVRLGQHVLEFRTTPASLEAAERAVERIEAALGSEALGTDTKAWDEAVKDGRFSKALRRELGRAVQRGRLTGTQFDAAPRSLGEAATYTSNTGAAYVMQHVHVFDADGNARSPYLLTELKAGSSPDSAAKEIVEKLLATPALLEGLGRQRRGPGLGAGQEGHADPEGTALRQRE